MNKPVAWMNIHGQFNKKETWLFPIPLYTHQYERPHNTVLVPCDKLAEMQAEITKLKLEWQYMADLTEKLQDFAIWMTGCGYDFTQHEYFIECRDELLKGVRNEQ